MPPPRIAIVSDPLVQHGGAERTVEALADAFPDAPIFAILYDPVKGPPSLQDRVIPSFLGRVPLASRRHRLAWPLFRAAVESFDLRDFDVIISSHHTSAKSLVRRADQLHICYCHTPMRALWERPFQEIATLPKPLRVPGMLFFNGARARDASTSNRVDHFIANSRETQRRIASHYRRTSRIIFPPIEIDRFTPGADEPADSYLVASRAVPYKRIDVAIEACERLGRKLVVTGPRPRGLETSDRISFIGQVSDDELVGLMQRSKALLYPPHEDFGMTPLEMNACGRPVIALAAGGALETVVHGVTGILASAQTPEAFAQAILQFEATDFDRAAIREHTRRFARERYIAEMRDFVDLAWTNRDCGNGMRDDFLERTYAVS